MSGTKLEKFHKELQAHLPGFKIAYKDESKLMKVIDKILFFNKKFMTDFTTVLGQTVYFPSKQKVEENQDSYIATLAHEYVHAKDAKRFTNVLFGFLYLVPVSLSPFMWLFAFVHWALALSLFLLFLAPLPAYWRKHFEFRGYVMSLFIRNEIFNKRNLREDVRRALLESAVDKYNEHFTGPNYYFMWPFGVKKKLLSKIDPILSDSLVEEDELYKEVRNAFEEVHKN